MSSILLGQCAEAEACLSNAFAHATDDHLRTWKVANIIVALRGAMQRLSVLDRGYLSKVGPVPSTETDGHKAIVDALNAIRSLPADLDVEPLTVADLSGVKINAVQVANLIQAGLVVEG